jgi:hypothetical protein
MTNVEIQMTKERQNSKLRLQSVRQLMPLNFWAFIRHSDFVIRHSQPLTFHEPPRQHSEDRKQHKHQCRRHDRRSRLIWPTAHDRENDECLNPNVEGKAKDESQNGDGPLSILSF